MAGFKLNFNESQLELIKDKSHNIFASGGYRSGKSVVILYMITQIARFMPFSKILIGRKHYKDLRMDTLEILLNPNTGLWIGLGEFNKAEQIFYFKNGSIAFFRHFDDENSLKGPTTNVIFIEQAEEVKKEVYDVLKTRNSLWGNEDNPDSQYNMYVKKFGKSKKFINKPQHYFFVTSNPYPCWLYDYFIDEGSKDFHLSKNWKKYNLPTTVNRDNLPKGYLEDKQAEMSDQEFQQYIMGSWQFSEGRIYNEFDPEKHVVDPIDIKKYPDAKLIASIDTGYQHYTGVLFTGLLANGKLLCYDEIYVKETNTDEVARMIRIKEAQHGVKPDIYLLDYAANRTSAVSGKSEGDVFREHKIPVISADKEVYAGLMRGKSLFKKDMVSISSVCKNMIKELGLYVWNAKQPDKPLKKSDDLMDPFRYIVNKCFKNTKFNENAHVQMTSEQMMNGFFKDMITNKPKTNKNDIKYGLT